MVSRQPIVHLQFTCFFQSSLSRAFESFLDIDAKSVATSELEVWAPSRVTFSTSTPFSFLSWKSIWTSVTANLGTGVWNVLLERHQSWCLVRFQWWNSISWNGQIYCTWEERMIQQESRRIETQRDNSLELHLRNKKDDTTPWLLFTKWPNFFEGKNIKLIGETRYPKPRTDLFWSSHRSANHSWAP